MLPPSDRPMETGHAEAGFRRRAVSRAAQPVLAALGRGRDRRHAAGRRSVRAGARGTSRSSIRRWPASRCVSRWSPSAPIPRWSRPAWRGSPTRNCGRWPGSMQQTPAGGDALADRRHRVRGPDHPRTRRRHRHLQEDVKPGGAHAARVTAGPRSHRRGRRCCWPLLGSGGCAGTTALSGLAELDRPRALPAARRAGRDALLPADRTSMRSRGAGNGARCRRRRSVAGHARRRGVPAGSRGIAAGRDWPPRFVHAACWPTKSTRRRAGVYAQVAAGSPVLVLQQLGVGPWPAWHYAVVIGYDRTTATRHPALGHGPSDWRCAPRLRGHVGAGRSLGAGGPAPGPAACRRRPRALHAGARRRSRRCPTRRRPAVRTRCGRPLAGDSAAAARSRQRRRRRAATGAKPSARYRAALDIDSSQAAALNNRAEALRHLGCPAAALESLLAGLGHIAADDPLQPALAQTRREIAGVAATAPPAAPECAQFTDH